MIYFVAFLLTLNTILLVAIAGSLIKLVTYLQEGPSEGLLKGIFTSRRVFDPQVRMPDYAEIAFPAIEGNSSNWDGVAKTPNNWDGLPKKEE